MKRRAVVLLSTIILGAGFGMSAHAVELLRWERLPLTIALAVGHERVVFIDRNVRIGLPPSVGERLRVQSAGGALYLRASAPIEPTRLQLQDADTGELILIDISAQIAEQDSADVLSGLEEQYDAFARGAAESLLAEENAIPTGDELADQFERYLARENKKNDG